MRVLSLSTNFRLLRSLMLFNLLGSYWVADILKENHKRNLTHSSLGRSFDIISIAYNTILDFSGTCMECTFCTFAS